ncbi:MAG: twin-arginine translocase subunit TatB [Thiobacillaceae bacterium]|jgi:sec-independent protein translocase protein TatB|nr:twin-arginine translocase subunit TatB [Thiobacillaceae bacterium]MBP9916118.1 twin-arginine translocase subunit TatB [Thiobacillaceae bacterium]
MFDLGFSELLVIGLVALVVIGPERLPKVARSAGQWLGKLNRYVSQVKQDIDRDIKLEELRKMQQDMKDAAQKYEIMAGDVKREAETVVEQETTQISRVMQAMSVTDGGLAMQEYEKIKAEASAAGDANTPGEGEALPALAATPATEAVDTASTAGTGAAEAGPPPPKVARAPDGSPDGSAG